VVNIYRRRLLAYFSSCSINADLQVATYYELLTERLLTVCRSTVWTSSVLEPRRPTNRRSKKKQQCSMLFPVVVDGDDKS